MAPQYGMIAGIDLLTLEGRLAATTRAASLRDLADPATGYVGDATRAAAIAEAKALESWLRSYYSTSKYGDAVAEAADAVILEGFAEDTIGSVDEGGHYALVVVADAPMSQRYVILATDSLGFVGVFAKSHDRDIARRMWAEIVASFDL